MKSTFFQFTENLLCTIKYLYLIAIRIVFQLSLCSVVTQNDKIVDLPKSPDQERIEAEWKEMETKLFKDKIKFWTKAVKRTDDFVLKRAVWVSKIFKDFLKKIEFN